MKYGRFKCFCINEWFFFKACGRPNYWFERCGGSHGSVTHSLCVPLWGRGFDSHLSNLECWSFHKHFISFVCSCEGLCSAFAVVQRCWNRLLLSASTSPGLQRCARASWKGRTRPCFWCGALSPDSLWRYSSCWRSEEPRWNQFIYLLPVLVNKITVQFWFFRTSCQLEKKKDKQISQLALDSTVLRLDTVSRESGSIVQKTLVIHQRCTYC